MALLDLLGRRWALRIIWELRDDRQTFRALQAGCGGVSPTVLSRRLQELREGGIINATDGDGYGLTPLGHEFRVAFSPLIDWSRRWAKMTTPR